MIVFSDSIAALLDARHQGLDRKRLVVHQQMTSCAFPEVFASAASSVSPSRRIVANNRADFLHRLATASVYLPDVLRMNYPVEVPDWLLQRLFLKRALLHEERTVVISGSQEDATDSFLVDLTQRSDWDEVRNRLENEGFLNSKGLSEAAAADSSA